jgi:hypothetical protein
MKQILALLSLISLLAMSCSGAAAMSTEMVAQEMTSLSLDHPVAADDPVLSRDAGNARAGQQAQR